MDSHAPRLGEGRGTIAFDTRRRNRELAAAMAAGARRSIAIFTPDLEPPVYDDAGFLAALTRLATSGAMARVRVLVRDPTPAVKRGHRLIETARRLSTTIRLHRAADEHRQLTEAFLVVDETGYIHKPVPDRYEGEACFQAGARCRELLQQFDAMWEISEPDPELRRLHI